MNEAEFRATLPQSTDCPGCQAVLPDLLWSVARYKSSEWVGICVTKCPNCPWMKVAAAGSTEEAQEAAQAARSRLLRLVGK